jgi:hypothetical protein
MSTGASLAARSERRPRSLRDRRVGRRWLWYMGDLLGGFVTIVMITMVS